MRCAPHQRPCCVISGHRSIRRLRNKRTDPRLAREDPQRWQRVRNVHAKISGLMPILVGGSIERATPPSVGEIVDAIGPLAEHALATFGDGRCMFASNFPMDKVRHRSRRFTPRSIS